MATVTSTAERELPVPADEVFAALADYREARPKLLPDNYRDYRVEEGGTGAGTVIAYLFVTGRREREYRLHVDIPEPGRVISEHDERSSFTTTWTVQETGASGRSRVTVTSSWSGAGGIAGLFERLFAPGGLRRVYEGMLVRLEDSLR